MSCEYIYLLQEREFIKTSERIYKIGMTQKMNHERFNQYPKGSVLLFQMICINCKSLEQILIKKFKAMFLQRKDIGTEYFEGDYTQMINVIYNVLHPPSIQPKKEEEDIFTAIRAFAYKK